MHRDGDGEKRKERKNGSFVSFLLFFFFHHSLYPHSPPLAPMAATDSYSLTLEDKIHYGFFASHIPITLLMDGQALLPSSLFPPFVRR
jgi:hypothetical protein